MACNQSGDARLAGFECFPHTEGAYEHDVYVTGKPADRPLLVIHELPGFTVETLNFARRLAARGFRVYLPHLFGGFLENDTLGNEKRLCVSAEFANLAAGVSAPVTTWLRSLARRISALHGDGKVGALGMCLTGGFAIPLVLERPVVAPVCAQPAVPFSKRFVALGFGKGPWAPALNVSDDDVRGAKARMDRDDLKLLAFRFDSDRICVAEKMGRLKAEFGNRVEVHQLKTPWMSRFRLPTPPHAVFTYEYEKAKDAGPEHPTRRAFETLVSFFQRQL